MREGKFRAEKRYRTYRISGRTCHQIPSAVQIQDSHKSKEKKVYISIITTKQSKKGRGAGIGDKTLKN